MGLQPSLRQIEIGRDTSADTCFDSRRHTRVQMSSRPRLNGDVCDATTTTFNLSLDAVGHNIVSSYLYAQGEINRYSELPSDHGRCNPLRIGIIDRPH